MKLTIGICISALLLGSSAYADWYANPDEYNSNPSYVEMHETSNIWGDSGTQEIEEEAYVSADSSYSGWSTEQMYAPSKGDQSWTIDTINDYYGSSYADAYLPDEREDMYWSASVYASVQEAGYAEVDASN